MSKDLCMQRLSEARSHVHAEAGTVGCVRVPSTRRKGALVLERRG